jgi:hypothetical protein
MPTETDVKLAGDLADFRVEVAERFGQADARIAERFGQMDTRFAAVETELRIIRKLGTWLLGVGAGIIGTMIVGAATVAWAASAVVSDVKHQGQRIDRIEGRLDAMGRQLDAMGKQLDTLISRPAPKPGG